jgi:hypothetical protein
MSRTLPRKDSEFIPMVRNLSDQCSLHQADWNLEAAPVTQLNQLVHDAEAAYRANLNPETANHLTATTKKVSFAVLRAFLSTFVNVLVANKLISDADIEAMGLPSREHHFHQPLPVPGEAPEVSVMVGQHHDVTLYVAIPQHGQPSEFLTKKGFHGFVVRYRKSDETEWHEEHSTRLHLTLLFDSGDEGKHLVVTVAWINPRIQHGPWSDEITVLIN